ncbi:MAG: GAF domain-containing protein [Chloroflexi bacterium]|nr:GAF domain-containing protein [Chloroflexota bacterium]
MFESLLAQAPIGIAVLGANGYFIATYARLNEFVTTGRHRTIFDITPHHLHVRLRQQLTAVKRTGETSSLQIPLYDRERRIKWMQLTIENDSAYNLIAYFTPIDQYKSLQEMMMVLGSEPVILENMLNEVAGFLNCNAVSIIRADGTVTAMWKDGKIRCDYEHNLASSPCASVLRKGDIIYIPMHVQSLYPQATALKVMDIQGYFGLPITDNGDVLGVLSIMSRNALIIDDLHVAILRLFAMRASGVLRYNKSDSEICPELETHG